MKGKVLIDGTVFDFTTTANDIQIIDSYLVSKKFFQRALENIKKEEEGAGEKPSQVWQRKMKSLRKEWATHNLCYALHIKRSSTKDVDLNYPQKWEWAYNFVGTIALWFIK